MLAVIEGRRRREQQKMRWLDGITDSMDMSLVKLWEIVRDREGWRAAVHAVAELDTTDRLSNNIPLQGVPFPSSRPRPVSCAESQAGDHCGHMV